MKVHHVSAVHRTLGWLNGVNCGNVSREIVELELGREHIGSCADADRHWGRRVSAAVSTADRGGRDRHKHARHQIRSREQLRRSDSNVASSIASEAEGNVRSQPGGHSGEARQRDVHRVATDIEPVQRIRLLHGRLAQHVGERERARRRTGQIGARGYERHSCDLRTGAPGRGGDDEDGAVDGRRDHSVHDASGAADLEQDIRRAGHDWEAR